MNDFLLLIMFNIKHLLVALVIAVLFTAFVQTSINAVYQSPEYDDYCDDRDYNIGPRDRSECSSYEVSDELKNSCEGEVRFEYNDSGCRVDAYCEDCMVEYEDANEFYSLVAFIISSILGLLAIGIGLYIPLGKKEASEWIKSGLILGGLFTILFVTIQHFGDLGRYIRPLVLLAELCLVIYLSYKKL